MDVAEGRRKKKHSPDGLDSDMNQLSIAQAAYIAALVDGEGSIFIHFEKKPTYLRYSPQVRITNTNKSLLQSVLNDTGIGHIVPACNKMPNSKPGWIWTLRRWEMAEFLTAIKPYLRAKDFQADLMLEFLTMRKGHPTRPFTDGEIHTRRVIHELMTELNKRGVQN